MIATSRWSVREAVYFGLLLLGTAIPYTHFIAWLTERGFDVPLFIDELFVNRISSFFGWDVIISALTLLTLALVDRELPGRDRAIVAVSALLGASVGLPMYLWLLQRHRRRQALRLPAGAGAPLSGAVQHFATGKGKE